jgi:hypothetical protein
MSNHVHLVFRSINDQNLLLIGDFKAVLTKSVDCAIQEPRESRKEFYWSFFHKEAEKVQNVKQHHL